MLLRMRRHQQKAASSKSGGPGYGVKSRSDIEEMECVQPLCDDEMVLQAYDSDWTKIFLFLLNQSCFDLYCWFQNLYYMACKWYFSFEFVIMHSHSRCVQILLYAYCSPVFVVWFYLLACGRETDEHWNCVKMIDIHVKWCRHDMYLLFTEYTRSRKTHRKHMHRQLNLKQQSKIYAENTSDENDI